MNSFEIVASSTESTVVAEYTPEKRKSTDYQSEAALEQDFINRLVSQPCQSRLRIHYYKKRTGLN